MTIRELYEKHGYDCVMQGITAQSYDAFLQDHILLLEKALGDMRFAYINKDGQLPHGFEDNAMEQASGLIGKWPTDWKSSKDS